MQVSFSPSIECKAPKQCSLALHTLLAAAAAEEEAEAEDGRQQEEQHEDKESNA